MKPETFLSLESTFAQALSGAWKDRADQTIADLLPLAEAGDLTAAHGLASGISLKGLVRKDALVPAATAALLFGASAFAAPRDTVIFRGHPDTDAVIQGALGQLQTIVEHHGTETVAWQTKATLDGEAYAKAQPFSLFKADAALADKLNAAVMGTGKALIDIGANQTTSRLIAFGFLAQAQAQGETTYQITEVLDTRICPVCKFMHGKTFRVADEMSRLKQVLQTHDTADLKVLAPWPKQSRASLERLFKTKPAQLQSDGLGSPPFHPQCRGMLTPQGTVTEDMPVQAEEAPMAEIVKRFFAPAAKPAPVEDTGPVLVKLRAPAPLQPADEVAHASEVVDIPGDRLKGATLDIRNLLDKVQDATMKEALKSLWSQGHTDEARHILEDLGIL